MYLRYPISFTHMADDGRAGTCYRWQLHLALVQVYGTELDRRRRPHLKPTNRSWRLDETYINIKRRDRFLYRAVHLKGQTIDSY
jgi:transposase, IS6 family